MTVLRWDTLDLALTYNELTELANSLGVYWRRVFDLATARALLSTRPCIPTRVGMLIVLKSPPR